MRLKRVKETHQCVVLVCRFSAVWYPLPEIFPDNSTNSRRCVYRGSMAFKLHRQGMILNSIGEDQKNLQGILLQLCRKTVSLSDGEHARIRKPVPVRANGDGTGADHCVPNAKRTTTATIWREAWLRVL